MNQDFADLGAYYDDGQSIIDQGDEAKAIYLIQQGQVEVIVESEDGPKAVAVLKAGEMFGEMSLFTRDTRSATVRALGNARVMSIKKDDFLKRIHEDPSLAFRMLEKLSDRIMQLNDQVSQLKQELGELKGS